MPSGVYTLPPESQTAQPKNRGASQTSFYGLLWRIEMLCEAKLARGASGYAFQGPGRHIDMLCEFRVGKLGSGRLPMWPFSF